MGARCPFKQRAISPHSDNSSVTVNFADAGSITTLFPLHTTCSADGRQRAAPPAWGHRVLHLHSAGTARKYPLPASNCVFRPQLSGFELKLRGNWQSDLASIAEQMGAVHKFDLTSDVTHLNVRAYDNPKYKFVAKSR